MPRPRAEEYVPRNFAYVRVEHVAFMFRNADAVIAGLEVPIFRARTNLLLDPRVHRLPPPPVLGINTPGKKLDWYMHIFGALNEQSQAAPEEEGASEWIATG
jgi:hypothetical protein